MGRLTTHVLDTAAGRPAAGIAIRLYRLSADSRDLIAETVTNSDGRTDKPMLEGTAFRSGTYELVFACGPYLEASGATLTSPMFLSEIPLRFGIAEDAHYHVPLLLSPYGYSTYRGS